MKNLLKLKSFTKSQNSKSVKIINFIFIPIFIFLCQIFFLKEIKANVYNYRTYTDKRLNLLWHYSGYYKNEEATRIYIKKQNSYIWKCPVGKTRLGGVFNPDTPNRGGFENLEGYFFQNIPNLNKGWDLSINYEYYKGNRLRNNSFRFYPNIKLKSISSSLFFIPPEKEVYLEDYYENFKANIEEVIDSKNYYKLKSIYFIKNPKCNGSPINCPKENAMHEFINGNRKVYLIDSMSYQGDFLLMNSKKEVFDGLAFYDNDFQTISCKDNILIHGIVNSFTIDSEDDLGNIKRGPLLFLLREAKYELQNEKKNYIEPTL